MNLIVSSVLNWIFSIKWLLWNQPFEQFYNWIHFDCNEPIHIICSCCLQMVHIQCNGLFSKQRWQQLNNVDSNSVITFQRADNFCRLQYYIRTAWFCNILVILCTYYLPSIYCQRNQWKFLSLIIVSSNAFYNN